MKKKVYLAGAVTSDFNYKEKFAQAEFELELLGFNVLNPVKIPYKELSYNNYFPICYGLIEISRYVVIIDYSKGVQRELDYIDFINTLLLNLNH